MRIFTICIFLYATFFIASADKKIVCFWGTWATYRQGYGKFDVENIDPTICTHIIYSFLGASSNGDVKYLDSYLDLSDNFGRGYIDKFIALKSKSPSTKFLMSIGGWSAYSAVFSQIASSASTRNAFA
ncbi:putative Chitinase ChiA, partial [Polypedilum vanderplanki]